jgi:hypothetical protein
MAGNIDRVARWALAVSAVVALFGCTHGVDSDTGEKVGRSSSTVSAPTTFTIAVPNPLSPIAPVLGASNSLSLGANDDVVGTVVAMGSGGFSTQPQALVTGDAWSVGEATLADRSTIHGTLHAASVALGNSVVIGARDTTPHFDPNSTLK